MELNSSFSDKKRVCTSYIIETWQRLLLVVLCVFLALAAFIGNSLVILTVYRTPVLRTINNCLLTSLAVADLLTGSIAVPIYIGNLLLFRNPFQKSSVLSNAVDASGIVIYISSTYSICAVSVDRFVSVKYALRYNSIMTFRRCSYVIASIWIFSFIYVIFYWLFRFQLTFLGEYWKIWMAASIIIYATPVVVTISCYGYILKEALRQTRSITVLNVQQQAQQSNTRKTNLTVALVVGISLLCVLPIITQMIYVLTVGCSNQASLLLTWAVFAAYGNCAVNPWIYGLRRREFRDVFKKLLRPCGP